MREKGEGMTRWSAAGFHLAVSILIGIVFVAGLRGLWFPGPLFEESGAAGLLTILVPVDVLLGPLLTFLVFKPNKPSLRFDLTVIALLQAVALSYGAWVIAEARPVYVVFFGNQLHVVRSTDVAENRPWEAPLSGPLWVAIPSSGAVDSELTNMMALIAGKTVTVLDTTKYRSLAEQQDAFVTAMRKVVDVQPVEAVSELQSALIARGWSLDHVAVLPIMVRDQRMTAVFAGTTPELVDIVPVTLLAQ